MNRGRFIAFEGGEGVGKSTQARMLSDTLQARGIGTVLTREPGGTPGAEAIRALLLDPPGEGWAAEAEAMLFAAARSDHVAKLIQPALKAGKWVITDRYLDSTRAYQGGGSGLSDASILKLHEIGCGGLMPDCTLLIQAAPHVTEARLRKRDGDESDAIGGRAEDYHLRVARAFEELARSEPHRFAIIDGHGGPEDIHQRIVDALDTLLGEDV